ncbi:MAG: amidohydrolase family protein [Bacteroidetes bacterium]|nr:amidohydrolase family protein [Bacteroidota bacterium]
MNETIKIIENGLVFTGDKAKRSGKINLLIRKDSIIDMDKPAHVWEALYPSAEKINANGKVVLPGFVDAHHIGESFILRYINSGQPMARWNKKNVIGSLIDYLHKEASYEDFLNLYRLSYCSALKSGVTTIAEYGFDTPANSFSAALESMKQIQVKGVIGLHNSDQIEAAKKINEPFCRFACAISSEENLTTYNFQSTIRIAQENKWPVMLPLGQTQHGYDIIKKNFNKSIVQLYADYNAFDSPVHLLNLAYLDDNDASIIEKSGLPLVLSPMSILSMKTGIPPFEKLYRHNVTVALGSGWGTVRPLENIHSYASFLKIFGLPYGEPYDLLALHTRNGAVAVGMDNEIGTIETGRKADIVFLDFSEFRVNAILSDDNTDRILNAVMQEAVSQYISDVMINGEFCVRNGQLLIYPENDLLNESKALMGKILHIAERHKLIEPVSVKISPASVKNKKESQGGGNDLPYEEGFRIIQKARERINSENKNDQAPETIKKPSKTIKKIFGDDEV